MCESEPFHHSLPLFYTRQADLVSVPMPVPESSIPEYYFRVSHIFQSGWQYISQHGLHASKADSLSLLPCRAYLSFLPHSYVYLQLSTLNHGSIRVHSSPGRDAHQKSKACLLYTSDAADEEDSV